ncbi:copper resistance CopC family protein [Streptomyces palmae]|uniref:Copper resistance protein CopC n=2 Tax=Streptomyces palmae TaxID=1701085 RepID=A0A4Z0HF05_9ACTN|nr:copper resistance protein CopC [Streptomyces palmae]TGB17385.1 copper resistance protein CopC [Streptomyces palmae]
MALLPATLWVLLSSPPAWAHARLLDSSPAADAVVARAPAAVRLHFDGPVSQAYTTVVVAGLDGRSYSDGAPTVRGGDVRQKVSPLPSGRIQVTWRTVAADGAPLQGRYTFTNADKTAPTQPSPAPTAPTAPAARAPSPAAGSAASGGSLDAGDWPWWAAGGGLVAATAVLLAVGVRRSAAAPRPPRREDAPRG